MNSKETVGQFTRAVLAIQSPDEAQAFFEARVTQLRLTHPDVDAEAVLRADIGYIFGEGMAIETRKMWTNVCGAEHPALGKMEQDPTPDEAFRIGMAWGEAHRRRMSLKDT